MNRRPIALELNATDDDVNGCWIPWDRGGQGPVPATPGGGAAGSLRFLSSAPRTPCKIPQRQHVGRGRVAGDLAAGGHDIGRARLAMALDQRPQDRLRRAVADRRDRIEVAGQHLAGAHRPAGFLQRHQVVDVHQLAAQRADLRENPPRVAADVQPHLHPQGVQGVDQPPLIGQHELLVDLRAHQRRRGVAHAHQVRPRGHLGRGETGLHVEDELEQVADEGRIVEEIGHQAVDAAEVGGLGAGTLDPALDDPLAADPLVQEGHRLHPVVHPAAAQRVGHFQAPSTALSTNRAWVSSMAGGWLSK